MSRGVVVLCLLLVGCLLTVLWLRQATDGPAEESVAVTGTAAPVAPGVDAAASAPMRTEVAPEAEPGWGQKQYGVGRSMSSTDTVWFAEKSDQGVVPTRPFDAEAPYGPAASTTQYWK